LHRSGHRGSLARVLQDLGELPAARQLLERALASDLKTYGEDHPNIATFRNNLAAVLQDLIRSGPSWVPGPAAEEAEMVKIRLTAGAPTSPEALVRAGDETRPGLHEGIGAAYDETASGYRFAARGLSNAEVRAWYAAPVRTLDSSGPLMRESAARVDAARNALKAEARGMTADRAVAAELARTQALRPLEHYVEKYGVQGFSGEALWGRIIRGGTTPDPAVNAAHEVQ
jgi:hypothetical protein